MTNDFVPCCGDHHVVRADSRLCGSPLSIHASVVFRSRSDLDNLIVALERLHDNWDHPTAHFHLQDYELSSDSCDPSQLEITFCTPTWVDTETEAEVRQEMISDARKSLRVDSNT